MLKLKKLLISLLTSFMLVMPIGYNGIIAEEPTVLTTEEDADIPADIAERVTNIVINFAWAYSGGGKFLYGACLSGGVAGILSLSLNLLKMTGIFGESEEDIQRRELNQKLDSIENKIDELGDKIDSLQNSINESLKQIDSSLSDISVKLDKDNLTNVARVASTLENEKNNYEDTLNSHIRDWYQNYNFSYTNDKLIVYVQIDDDNEIAINLPKDVITTILQSEPAWDVNKIEELVKKVFGDIADYLIENKDSEFANLVSSLYSEKTWDELTLEQQNNVKEKFVEGGYNSLSLECAKRIAYARSSGAKTYISELIDSFTVYCNYLSEAEGLYTSPLTSQYNIYSKLYAFQGDLDCSYEYDGKTINTNLAQVARDKYIIELSDIASFVTAMAIASESYTENSLKKLIYVPWAQAEKHLNETYDNFYHYDIVGRSIKNYCYATNSVLEYRDGDLNCEIDMRYYAWENGFGTDIKSFRETFMNKDWTYSIPNEAMTSTSDMNRLYAYYLNIGSGSMIDYLYGNKVIVNYNNPREIITRFIGGKDFTSSDKVKMFIKNCHNNPDKYSGKDYLKGDTTTITNTSEYVRIRKKAVADVFNISTGQSTNDKRIGAVASFYEKWTFKDDLVLFWDAEYNNPETKEDLIFLAEHIDYYNYYRDRYDTKKDDEERYLCSFDYTRTYGAIVEVPVSYYETGSLYSVEGAYREPTLKVNFVGNGNISNSNEKALFSKYVELYEKTKQSSEEKFRNALIASGISEEEYEEFFLDDSYTVYFDEYGHEDVTEETYKALIEYVENNFDKLTEEYDNYNEKIYKVVNRENNKTNIKLSDEEYSSLVKAIIEDGLDCEIVNRIPLRDLGKNVYYNDELYTWNDKTNRYEKYSSKANVISKLDVDQEEGGERVTTTTTENLFEKDNYPKSNATNFEVTYRVDSIIAFELLIDDDGNVGYEIHPLYDIKPTLTWVEDKTVKCIEINSRVYESQNIGSMEVMIPVIQLVDNKDNRAQIHHYYNLSQIDEPIETFTKEIAIEGDSKYSLINVSSFSPFYVNSTSYKSNQYIAPVTGVN